VFKKKNQPRNESGAGFSCESIILSLLAGEFVAVGA
jgi:hypothetical protein